MGSVILKQKPVQSNCSICLKEEKDIDNIIKLSCGHKFCLKCIMNWLNTKLTCPNCRYILTLNERKEYMSKSIEEERRSCLRYLKLYYWRSFEKNMY